MIAHNRHQSLAIALSMTCLLIQRFSTGQSLQQNTTQISSSANSIPALMSTTSDVYPLTSNNTRLDTVNGLNSLTNSTTLDLIKSNDGVLRNDTNYLSHPSLPPQQNLHPQLEWQNSLQQPQGHEAKRQQQIQQQQREQPSERIQWPMVDVDRTRNRSTVDVHVPIFFDMVNHNDKEGGQSRLDLSVLQGLVTVNRDKSRDQNGQLTTPLKVTVFGIPVYTSRGYPRPSTPAESAKQRFDDALTQVNSTLGRKADDLVAQMTEKVQRTNDKMLGSLSDIFERFSMVMRQTSKSMSNGPAKAVDATTTTSKPAQQQEQQQQQPSTPLPQLWQHELQREQKPMSRLDAKALKSKYQMAAELEFAKANSNKPLAERVSYDFRH